MCGAMKKLIHISPPLMKRRFGKQHAVSTRTLTTTFLIVFIVIIGFIAPFHCSVIKARKIELTTCLLFNFNLKKTTIRP